MSGRASLYRNTYLTCAEHRVQGKQPSRSPRQNALDCRPVANFFSDLAALLIPICNLQYRNIRINLASLSSFVVIYATFSTRQLPQVLR